ncbi:hypothetical protein EI94DRAFT_1759551, partial [Lactarius quietus]
MRPHSQRRWTFVLIVLLATDGRARAGGQQPYRRYCTFDDSNPGRRADVAYSQERTKPDAARGTAQNFFKRLKSEDRTASPTASASAATGPRTSGASVGGDGASG